MVLCFSTSSMETCRVWNVGRSLDSKWQPRAIAETRIATVTESLIFTSAICFIMAQRNIVQVSIWTRVTHLTMSAARVLPGDNVCCRDYICCCDCTKVSLKAISHVLRLLKFTC